MFSFVVSPGGPSLEQTTDLLQIGRFLRHPAGTFSGANDGNHQVNGQLVAIQCIYVQFYILCQCDILILFTSVNKKK